MQIFKLFLISFVTVAALWVLGFAVFCGTSLLRAQEHMEQSSDAIIVLTGGKARISSGLALVSSGRATHLFISGVNKGVRKSEILAQAETPSALPSCCIELGYEATTTEQNAVETESWLRGKGFTSIRLVTSDYHMNRALMELRHHLPGVEIFVHPLKEPSLSLGDLYFWRLMFLEYHKTLFRSFQLTFTPRPPSFVEDH